MGAAVDIQVIDQFSDQRWRLHNLYYIVNDQGKEVHFVPNDAQTDFYSRMWYRNLLLKGRQFGFTTFIDILMLDACVFYPNQTAGIIAFTLEDVKKIFRRKIRHPYDRLPDGIRALNPPTNDTQNELVLANKSEIGVDTGFRGGTYNFLHICLAGDAKVLLADGETRRIDEVCAGDRVLTSKGSFQHVKAVVRNRLSDLGEQMIAVRTFGNPHTLRLTGSHRMMCRDRGVWRKERGRATWKRADELTVGDYVAYPIREPSNNLRGKALRIGDAAVVPSFDFGRLCGLYISEGHRRRTEVTFCIDKSEIHEVESLLDKFAHLYKSRRTYRVRTSRTAMVTINNGALPQWMEDTFGHLAWNKTIPDKCWKWGAPFLRGLLKGYMDGDGHYGDPHTIKATTVSPRLAMQLKLLLISMRYGYPALYRAAAGERYGRTCREAWTLSLQAAGNWKFRKEHGLPLPGLGTGRARWRVEHGMNPGGRKLWRRGANVYWARVTAVADAAPEDFVYDLALDDSPHDYVTMNGVVHNSEYGKISAVYPEKATEIKVGSFNTVHPGNYIFVESTGHGKGGEFYDLAQASRRVAKQGRGLTPYDFKYFFYPWWQKKEYTLSEEDAKHIVITRKDQEYFAKVERRTGARLTFGQKTWYIVQREINGAEMKREFPSHDEEPFEALLRGAIFGEQMMAARAEGRITRVPHERGLAVHTWWDIGRRDKTAVWFFQMIGRELRFIWYHEQAFKEFPYWAEYCDKQRREQGWNFGQHFGPHDLGLVEYMATAGKTRAVVAAELGYVFRVGEQYNQKDQIEAARTTLPFCLFDEENCSDGITCLEQTRREWNDHLQMYLDTVVHDKFSHGGSSFMNGCMMLNGLQSGKPKAREVKRVRWAT